MAWRIEFEPRARDELARLDKPVQRRVLRFLRERLAPLDDPRAIGEPLRGPLKKFWKYRIGPYRLVCDIEEHLIRILVIRVGHRREVYKR